MHTRTVEEEKSGIPKSKHLPADQLQLLGNHDDGSGTRSAIGVALEKQNASLRKMMKEKEHEITELQHKIVQMESRERGIHFAKHCFTSI